MHGLSHYCFELVIKCNVIVGAAKGLEQFASVSLCAFTHYDTLCRWTAISVIAKLFENTDYLITVSL